MRWFFVLGIFWVCAGSAAFADINPGPPDSPVRLIFIHHSTGENWLSDYDGGLGIALRNNNYFVCDTNYGWGPDSIGDLTDIGHWWLWFSGPDSPTYLNALFWESSRYSDYSRLKQNPVGPNEIILFKSCFPNSNLTGYPNDPATTGDNPLRGQDCGSSHHTLANAKGIYNDLLSFFATRQGKLFVVITAPPLTEYDTDAQSAANARALNNWLVRDWLKNYTHRNVVVFDFYNVLTSNSGDRHTNDAGSPEGNHHRIWNGSEQHIQTVKRNTSAYAQDDWDSHPTRAGNTKATQEFVALLNAYYHCWKGTGDCPGITQPNALPVIDGFVADKTSGKVPLTVRFECTARDPDGAIADYRWDFDGNGLTDSVTTQGIIDYTYNTMGTYAASCTVTDNEGAAAPSSAITITISRTKSGTIRK
jgi:hypothetical protein